MTATSTSATSHPSVPTTITESSSKYRCILMDCQPLLSPHLAFQPTLAQGQHNRNINPTNNDAFFRDAKLSTRGEQEVLAIQQLLFMLRV